MGHVINQTGDLTAVISHPLVQKSRQVTSFCAKNIERIGDHAIKIAEIIYYIVQGRSLSHANPIADFTNEKMLPPT